MADHFKQINLRGGKTTVSHEKYKAASPDRVVAGTPSDEFYSFEADSFLGDAPIKI